MVDTLLVIVISLLVSFLISEIFHYMKYPRVIGQIITGIILGLPFFSFLFNPEAITYIEFLAELGIVFLLLLTGMQINIEKFLKSSRDSFIIATLSALVPFVCGFYAMKLLGYGTLVGIVVGACMCLMAEGSMLKVLIDLRLLNTRIGVTMLGAGILDDIFEIFFLSLIIILVQKSFYSLTLFPLKMLAFVGLIFLIYKLFPFVLRLIQRERSRIATFSSILIFGLLVAVLSEYFELGPIIGAFVAGIIIHLSDRKKTEYKENVKELEVMTFSFIIPFFFINIGLHFDMYSLIVNPWLVIIIVAVATAGKLLGAFLAKPFTSFSLKQMHVIGWGMNSRGAVELIVAAIAREAYLIPKDVYSAIVFMAVVTTLMFPFMLRYLTARDPTIIRERSKTKG